MLPRTQSPGLLVTIVMLAVLLAVNSVFAGLEFARAPSIRAGIYCLGSPLLAIGLWRLNPAARVVAVIVLWLLLAIVVLGLISPFAAFDIERARGRPLAASSLLAVLVPFAALVLFFLHMLGKHRADFRRRREPGASRPGSPVA